MSCGMGLLLVAGAVSLIAWPQHVAAGETAQGRRRLFTRRTQQEEEAIGLDIVAAPICPSGVECDEADYTKIIDALEVDDQVTVVADVEVGTLNCDSLETAASMSTAKFAISSTETVIAKRTSYTVVAGDVFSSGSGDRKVWFGKSSTLPPDGSIPRTVSMTWGEECDVQTFSLQVVTRTIDAPVTIVKSVPCDEASGISTCVVEIEVEYNEESEPVGEENPENAALGLRHLRTVDNAASAKDLEAHDKAADVRLLSEYLSATDEEKESFHIRGLRRLGEDSVIMPSGRRLTCGTQIDLLVLYTPEAMTELAITTAAQMETKIVEAFATTNAAFSNSDIPLKANVVHVAELTETQGSTTWDALTFNLLNNDDVATLRSTHGADAVQLVGSWAGTCGLGYIFNGNTRYALSVVDAGCFDNLSHTHELGHNLGCYHNRENSGTLTEFAHGYRYCDGTGRYRTVMSYACSDSSVPRENYFSNPDVSYLDKPTGTSTADNAQAIKLNMLTMANFFSQAGCVANGESCANAAECCVGTCSDDDTCEAVGCNGDPHLVGFNGQKFDFTGEDGLWFALVSDGPCHQTNIRVTAPVTSVSKITYITGVALSLCDSGGNGRTMEITVKEPHVLETSCANEGPCIADGALQVTLDGEDMMQPDQVNLGDGIAFAAVNLPGACRSFGFEKYWLAKLNQSRRILRTAKPVTAVPMVDWIMSDPLQTNEQECREYVNQAVHDGALYTHQSEHTSMQITSPQLSLRISHGKVHQFGTRDPTDTFEIPDHVAFQMNLVFENVRLGLDPQGLVGETVVPVVDAHGQPIMQGFDAIRGGENDYLVSGPFGRDFAQLHAVNI